MVMTTESLEVGNSYIVCADNAMIRSYRTLKEAQDHISYQKEEGSKAFWSIFHIKDSEWIKSY
jgi:hypothetical protein